MRSRDETNKYVYIARVIIRHRQVYILSRVATRHGNLNLFMVIELSGNFVNCKGNLKLLVNVWETSGYFENTRFESSY